MRDPQHRPVTMDEGFQRRAHGARPDERHVHRHDEARQPPCAPRTRGPPRARAYRAHARDCRRVHLGTCASILSAPGVAGPTHDADAPGPSRTIVSFLTNVRPVAGGTGPSAPHPRDFPAARIIPTTTDPLSGNEGPFVTGPDRSRSDFAENSYLPRFKTACADQPAPPGWWIRRSSALPCLLVRVFCVPYPFIATWDNPGGPLRREDTVCQAGRSLDF